MRNRSFLLKSTHSGSYILFTSDINHVKNDVML
jgi:hypothetical protein